MKIKFPYNRDELEEKNKDELINIVMELDNELFNLRYYINELILKLSKWDINTIKNYLKNCLIPIKDRINKN